MSSISRFHLALAPLILASVTTAPGAGEEQVGNTPLAEANYHAWPGLAAVVNDPSRVYYSWVNGNENCYYAGDAGALNRTLAHFNEAKLPVREVVIRPGPDKVRGFDGAREFTVHWHLQIFGGIAAHMTTRDRGDQVWPEHPRLTIYVGGNIDLDEILVPGEVTLVGLSELSARARRGTGSTDKSVRGWSAGVIAGLDPYDRENQTAIEALLVDDDDWVRLNAASAISHFGRQAATALPLLRECLQSENEQLKLRAARSIEIIESAPDQPGFASRHNAALQQISRFIDSAPGQPDD